MVKKAENEQNLWRQSQSNVLVFGHRGVKALFPENTMISFAQAILLGVDGIEMDLQMTKCGQLVVIHDKSLERTTNGKGLVSNFTYQELKKLDAGSHFSPEFAGERIPLFEEFLDFVKEKNVLLNVEIKEYKIEVADKTIKMLEEYRLIERSVITSFNADITTYVKKEYNVKTQGFPKWQVENFHTDTNSHYYSVGISMKDLTKPLCDEYRGMGIDPWCWCPDDEEAVKKAVDYGVSLCTCNNPLPALKTLKRT